MMRQLLIIVLNREEYLDDILAELLEFEVAGASVMEGVAMERVLAKDVPIFAGLLQTIQGSRAYNKNIFAVIPNRETALRLAEVLRGMGINLGDPAVGMLFTLPVDLWLEGEAPSGS
ncbi:MAG TPA: hypothetical protein PK878_05010 [bacterium]|nr:hypothetical protein [Candidatus Omnitrophota bacterium]HOJ59624.1 hypothetical protein [bacterium]HOL96207.1 hypothetical protein [bacterium]HPO99355.1 hypothetical protein [bacterium]HXK95422.1 hypothetical protein [bacterium]